MKVKMKVCDICGEKINVEGIPYFHYRFTLTRIMKYRGYKDRRRYDVCKKCQRKIEAYIKEDTEWL